MVTGVLRLAAALAIACLAAGCGGRPPEAVVFAVAKPPSVLDPRLATDAASERANALLYEPLVRLDEHGMPQAAMADWQATGPQTLRVRLRPGRRAFADGALPTAHDVVATYRSILDPATGSPHAGALDNLAAVEAVDQARVDFRLHRPEPLFAARLTVGIVPADRLAGDTLARAPQGSGEFAFCGWRADGGLCLRRRADDQRFTMTPVADPTMRTLKLIRGEADLLQSDLPAELYRQLARQPGIDLLEVPGTTFAYIGFNLQDPALSDRRVRQAIAHAIDRRAIVNYLFDGRAEPAESVLRPEHWAGVSDLAPHAFDPERARQLLRDAGYGPGRPLTLTFKTSTDPFRLRIAHVFQQQLDAVGIRLDIASYEWATFFGDIRAGNFQLYSLAWVGVNSPDILRYAFHSASLPPGGANRGGYRSPRLDRLLDAAPAKAPAAAAADYREAQRLVHRDLVYVPLWYEANVAASRGLAHYVPGRDGNYRALQEVARVGH